MKKVYEKPVFVVRDEQVCQNMTASGQQERMKEPAVQWALCGDKDRDRGQV